MRVRLDTALELYALAFAPVAPPVQCHCTRSTRTRANINVLLHRSMRGEDSSAACTLIVNDAFICAHIDL